MYKLTLSYEERKAIDWVGNRYRHGDDLFHILLRCETKEQAEGDETIWNSRRDVTYLIPEHLAWEIDDIGEDCQYLWACFGRGLSGKLTGFCHAIV